MADRIRRALFDILETSAFIAGVIFGIVILCILALFMALISVALGILEGGSKKKIQYAAIAIQKKEQSWVDQEPEAVFLKYRTGFRTWDIRRDGDRFALVSVGAFSTGLWPAREKLTARCAPGTNHTAPFPTCACGIYAMSTAEYIRDQKNDVTRRTFLGEVKLWGLTLEYSAGARAQFAYPLNITQARCITCDNYVGLEKASYYYLGNDVIAFCTKHNREVVHNSDHGFEKADPSFLSQIAEDYGIEVGERR